jgi:hypothetical protein
VEKSLEVLTGCGRGTENPLSLGRLDSKSKRGSNPRAC